MAHWLRATLPDARIRVSTHARGLRPLLPGLLGAGVSQFVIPIYGHEARIHDAVTRTAGSFAETLDALDALSEAGAKFFLTTLVTKQNVVALSELFLFLATYCEKFSVSVPLFSPGKQPDFVVGLACLKDRLEPALSALREESAAQVKLRNIPRCVVNGDHGAEFEISRPPRFGYEHRRHVKSAIKLTQTADGVMPDYQLMEKGDACKMCVHEETCPGFYKSYVSGGLFSFHPVREKRN